MSTPAIETVQPDRQAQAKKHERLTNWLFVVDLAVTLILLLVLLFSGLTRWLADLCQVVSANPWLYIGLYTAVLIVGHALLMLPLSYFSGFHLEHKFGLSNQTLASWIKDQLKGLALNLVLLLIVVNIIYFLLRRAPEMWWIWTGVFLFFFGILL